MNKQKKNKRERVKKLIIALVWVVFLFSLVMVKYFGNQLGSWMVGEKVAHPVFLFSYIFLLPIFFSLLLSKLSFKSKKTKIYSYMCPLFVYYVLILLFVIFALIV
jgi:hypothetical protein